MGKPGTSSTVTFIRLMDQFFDCLNVSNPLQGMQSRKPALEPYTSVEDWRFKVKHIPLSKGAITNISYTYLPKNVLTA
jgi:hypothetical protein